MTRLPLLSGIVVHWHNEALLGELIAAWPRDPRFELVVVDNGSSGDLAKLPAGALGDLAPANLARGDLGPGNLAQGDLARGDLAVEDPASTDLGPPAVRVLHPGRNLGFAGGVNAGAAAARAPLLLVLNPDAAPEPGALDSLLAGFEAHPEAAGLAPCLVGPAGEPQAAWQLRRLPSAWECVRQALPLPARASSIRGAASASGAPSTRGARSGAATLAASDTGAERPAAHPFPGNETAQPPEPPFPGAGVK